MVNTTLLDFDLIADGENGRLKHNENMIILDHILQLAVSNQTTTAPPGSPTNGDRYLIATGATGDWSTHVGDIAAYYDAWYYYTPIEGWLIYDMNLNDVYAFDGTNWNIISSDFPVGGTAGQFLVSDGTDGEWGGVNGTDDWVFISNSIYGGALTLFTQIGADVVVATDGVSLGRSTDPGLHGTAIGSQAVAVGGVTLGYQSHSYDNDCVCAGRVSKAGSKSVGIGAYALANVTSTTSLSCVCLGYQSGYTQTTATEVVKLGSYAGKYDTNSNRLIIDSYDRTNAAGELANAIIYGQMSNSGAASQSLIFNSSVKIYGDIGFFNTAPQSQVTIADLAGGTAGATYGATEQTMLQDVYDKVGAILNMMQANGLVSAT